MKINIKTFQYGHTILEMLISALVYSLLVGTMVMVLSLGLKGWQMGEIKTDTQHAIEIAIQRITNELKITHRGTCRFAQVPSGSDYYICFESAVTNNEFQIEEISREPVWQSHIIYYVIPENASSTKKILYRRVVPHYSSVIPKFLNQTALEGYLVPGPVGGNEARVISRNVENFEITSGSGNLICIDIECSKTMEERKLAYQQDFAKDIKARIKVTTSVSPRN